MRVNKTVNYNFQQNVINAGHTLLPHLCFQNCLAGINHDHSKIFTLGFYTINGTPSTAVHGWLEDRDFIYELSHPQPQPPQQNFEYYKAFSLSYTQLQRYLPIRSLDFLMDHRHFMLSYCRTHNYMIGHGYNMTYGGQLVPCRLRPAKKLKAIAGHVERKILFLL